MHNQPSLARRQLLALIAIAPLGSALFGRSTRLIHAVAFDAFVLFNPSIIVKTAREISPERGDALAAAASARLFSYTWYYTSAGRYAEFDELADYAFKSAAQGLGLDLHDSDSERLVDAYSRLELWPDVRGALDTLRRHGVRLAMLSNLSERMLNANLRANRIDEQFEFVLSTDKVRQYKPGPKAYDLAVQAFKAPKSEVGFAASASWDASGATWFGFPTAWVNRSGVAPEQAHAMPMVVSRGIDGVLQLTGVNSQ